MPCRGKETSVEEPSAGESPWRQKGLAQPVMAGEPDRQAGKRKGAKLAWELLATCESGQQGSETASGSQLGVKTAPAKG